MTQGIAIYNQSNEMLYYATHERNGKYLERENEIDKFEMLAGVDDCDLSYFSTEASLIKLIQELDLVAQELEVDNDIELKNHILEVMVLCRFCLWNLGKYSLVISPFEYVPKDKLPKSIPAKFSDGIAQAGGVRAT